MERDRGFGGIVLWKLGMSQEAQRRSTRLGGHVVLKSYWEDTLTVNDQSITLAFVHALYLLRSICTIVPASQVPDSCTNVSVNM